MDPDSRIKASLSAVKKAADKTVRMLLLGAGESGKTTVLKQLLLVHGKGFDEDARREAKRVLWYNILEGHVSVLDAMSSFGFEHSDTGFEKAADLIQQEFKTWNVTPKHETENIHSVLNVLWSDQSFQAVLKRRSEYYISDTWDELMKNLQDYPNWGGDKWVPSDNDVLLSRVRTTGIVERKFSVAGANFIVTDVGGQRSERRKWLRLFKDVNAVIYVAAINEYDQVLLEDGTTNRLTETLQLWKRISNSSEFSRTPFVLFLNKFDLFQKKYLYEKQPILSDSDLWKSVEGGPPPYYEQEEDEKCAVAVDWFKKVFLSVVDPLRRKSIDIHVTTALDTKIMKVVLKAAFKSVLMNNLALNGMEI